jgi:hypothetical protein
MKLNAVTRFKYTGDYYNFTAEEVTTTDPTSGIPVTAIERTHFFAKKIIIHVNNDSSTFISVYCKEPLRVYGILKNLKTKDGIELFEGGTWSIKSVEPVLSAIGTLEFYRHKASLDR